MALSFSPSVISQLATEPVGRLYLQPVVFRLCHCGHTDQHGVPAVHCLQLLPHLEAVSCSLIGRKNSTCQKDTWPLPAHHCYHLVHILTRQKAELGAAIEPVSWR